ncbi:hypothetical protein [Roseicella aerolata]|uniref:Uncharacterized protein n=1 Tax=Roseicella aerolata TaxID=2883479 RepID=A0A9X1II76_9PROT|nr:hypothetical protein [Roseicella aerolata]MCB4824957.1 hypothetical protein [Roseicella aerolata]
MAAAMQAMGALSVAVLAIPLLVIAWRVARLPLRSWLPILGFLGILLLIQGADALGAGEVLTVLMYLAAGFGR